MENINSVIIDAMNRSNEVIPHLTTEGCFKKHGCTDTAMGSKFIDPKFNTQYACEDYITSLQDWEILVDTNDILIASAKIPEGVAVESAIPLEKLPMNQMVTVAQLGTHPTLTTKGEPVSTDKITVIIAKDGGADPDLEEYKEQLAGKPILVTWFPGGIMPKSTVTDCEVGDCMKAIVAYKRGWRTVALV